MSHPRKLIEVALPLPEINDASSYDKMPGIGPHPKGIHHWWARLPLPSARAVLFASVVTDPEDDPAWKNKPAAQQDAERERLFGIVRRLMGKKLHEQPEVYAEARAEMMKHCGGKLPPVLDPFSGGGSIPLEAARLGFEAHAADLNPVAVLLNKCNLELAPRWANHPPVNTDDRLQIAGTQNWRGTQGLAADVRYYGKRIRERAQDKIGKLYPKARLPETHGGGATNVIAWIWARTVASPDPSARGKHIPVVSSFLLSKKAGNEVWIEPVKDESHPDGWHFAFHTGTPTAEQIAKAKLGTRAGKAKDFICFLSNTPVTRNYIQSEGKAGRLGIRLMAVIVDAKRGKIYIPADSIQESAAEAKQFEKIVSDARDTFLSAPLPNRAGITGGVCSAYGLATWGHLFTSRQLAALITFSDLTRESIHEIQTDAIRAGLSDADALVYATTVTTFLGLALDRCASFNNSLCKWNGNQTVFVFTKQALPMVWDFSEANIMGQKAVCWETAVDICAEALETLAPKGTAVGTARQEDAASSTTKHAQLLVSTDPPYYNNIGYAALSDFYYVWLRRTLGTLFPAIFTTMLVPKDPELTATPARFDGDAEKAKDHFESGFRRAFTSLRGSLSVNFPLTVYYAFKQDDSEEEDDSEDAGSDSPSLDLTTGWETLLEALISSGFQITATWPVRASFKWRAVALVSNTLASYIVLACRPRSADAPRVGRNAFVAELKRELPPALRHLQQGNVAPVDFAQAAIGPGMAVFSRYAAVLESSGQPMSVRKALALINGIKDEVLGESIEELDKDTRWAVQWFGEDKFEWGEAGKANLLANAQATAVNGLVAAGILEVEGNRVRLIPTEKLPADWNPEDDRRLTVWEMTHHLIRIYYHEKKGDAVTADLLRKLGNKADVARDLAYKLFTVCEKNKWSAEAQAYNALVLGWPDLVKLAQERPVTTTPKQTELI